MNYHALTIALTAEKMQQELLDKHCLRKHGANAYSRLNLPINI